MRARSSAASGFVALGLLLTSGCTVGGDGGEDAETEFRVADRATVALADSTGDPGYDAWTPWPQALHDAQHTSASTAVGPQTGAVRWRRELEGNVTPGPVVAADGTIYAASNAGVLHALDPATGRDLWTVDGGGSYGIDLSTSPAVLPSGLVLWPGPQSTLLAVTPAGDVAWRLELDGLVTSPAALADGTVAVGDDTGRVLLLEPTAADAGVVWDVDLGEASYGSVVVADDGETVYQSVVSGVVALRDGEVLWRTSEPSGDGDLVEVSPAVAPDGTVVVGSNDPHQYGLDPEDGSVRWRWQRDFWTYSSPSVTRDGIAYFGDHDNRVIGLDAATGALRFRYAGSREDRNPGGIGIWTSVVVDAEHTTYVGTRDGLVYAVTRDGELLWELRAGTTVDSYPALAGDGALLIGTVDGALLSIAD